jgi:hypothetical protein
MRRGALTPAQQGIAVTWIALLLAALLNAHGLRKTAAIQDNGARRDVAIAVTDGLVGFSDALYLSQPRTTLKAAVGRSEDDRIDTTIDFSPVAEPASVPRPQQPPANPEPRKPAPPREAKRAAFTPDRPMRLWVAGDSLMAVPAGSIERAAPAHRAVNIVGTESIVATGLGRPDVYNWFKRFQVVIRELRPDVVVLSFGSNDGHDFLSGVPAGVDVGALGSPTWLREYRRRIEGVTREFEAANAFVVWVGLPKTRGEGRNRGFRVVNSVLRAVAASNPEASTYVDTWRMFTNRFRSYVDYMRNGDGELVKMRAGDGVHYMPPAGDLLARHLFGQLHERYDLTSWKGRSD